MTAALQLVRNIVVLSWTILQSLVDYRRRLGRSAGPLTRTERADWMHVWCGKAMQRLRIEGRVYGPLPRGGLIVSNHLSYLDIFAFGSAMPCVFVSKAEVRNWPIFGTLTTIAGTVYIDRKRRSDTRNANDGIRAALQQNLSVLVFPEGTSSDGINVLPFYPSLFEPAVESEAPITAAHISYELSGGEVGRDIAYWGDMTFFPHLLRLLSRRNVSATVTFATVPRRFSNRKTAATEMRDEVLGLRHALIAS